MYKLPKEPYLTELIGQQVNQISVGPYDAQVAFEKGLVMQSLHKLEGEVAENRQVWFDSEWITTEYLMHVPQKEVVSVTNESEFIIKISLTGGIALYFHTEVSQYESIIVTGENRDIEVI